MRTATISSFQTTVLLMIFLSIGFGDVAASPSAASLYEHARTYYWLARARAGDSRDMLQAEAFAEAALDTIEDSENDDPRLRSAIEEMLSNAEDRYDNTFDNIKNEVPLFDLLAGGENLMYEFIDDPPVVAAVRAGSAVIESFPPSRPDIQYDVVITSRPSDTALEDELHILFGSDVRFFPRPTEDIVTIVGREGLSAIEGRDTRIDVFGELARGWDSTHLLWIDLVHHDTVDDVTYYGVYAHVFDAAHGAFAQSTYANGFAVDRRGTVPFVLLAIFLGLLLSAALAAILRPTFAFQPISDWSRTRILAGPTAFIVGLVFLVAVTIGARVAAPAPDTLFVDPVAFTWFMAIAIVLPVGSVLVPYVVVGRVPWFREEAADTGVIAPSVVGGVMAVVTLAAIIESVRLGNGVAAPVAVSGLVVVLSSAVAIGDAGGAILSRRSPWALWVILGQLLALVLWSIGVARSNPLVFAIGAATSVIMTLALISTRLVYARKGERQLGSVDTSATSIDTNEDLHKACNYPQPFLDPDGPEGTIGDLATDFITASSDRLGIVIISGEAGSGKTRFSIQLAEAVAGTGFVLFGDCDELNADGSGVPFEPVAQAFHDLLGAGRFEPAAKRTAKFNSGLQKFGIDAALGAVGLGAFMSLMGEENDDPDAEPQPSSVEQVARSTIDALASVLRKSRDPIVIVIDDLNIIDNLSAQLLTLMVRLASTHPLRERIYFVFSADDPENLPVDLVRTLEGIEETSAGFIRYLTSRHTCNVDRFPELLVSALRFTPDAAARFIHGIDQYAPRTWRAILQSVQFAVDAEMVAIESGFRRVTLTDQFDPARVPPPNDLIKAALRQLESVTDTQRTIVECAAFVGYEFNAEIIADVLKMDRLFVLQELRKLEDMGVLFDVVEQDDVYAFFSRAVAAAIRHVARVDASEGREVPQVAREYHHRVAMSMLRRMEQLGETWETIALNDLVALARRSYASGDRMLETTLTANVYAARRMLHRARYTEAREFAGRGVETAEKSRALSVSATAAEAALLLADAEIIVREDVSSVHRLISSAYERVKQLGDEIDLSMIVRLALLTAEYRSVIGGEGSQVLVENIVEMIGDTAEDTPRSVDHVLLRLALHRLVRDQDAASQPTLDSLLGLLGQLDDTTSGVHSYTRLRSEILEDAAIAAIEQSDLSDARARAPRALEAKDEPTALDHEGAIKVLRRWAVLESHVGNPEAARSLYDRAITRCDEVGLSSRLEELLLQRAGIARSPQEAVAYYERLITDVAVASRMETQIVALRALLREACRSGTDQDVDRWRSVVDRLEERRLIDAKTAADLRRIGSCEDISDDEKKFK